MGTDGNRYLSFRLKKLYFEVGLTGTPVTGLKEGFLAKHGGTAEDYLSSCRWTKGFFY